MILLLAVITLRPTQTSRFGVLMRQAVGAVPMFFHRSTTLGTVHIQKLPAHPEWVIATAQAALIRRFELPGVGGFGCSFTFVVVGRHLCWYIRDINLHSWKDNQFDYRASDYAPDCLNVSHSS